MDSSDDLLRSLREALRFSPDNVPLRKHVADTLLRMARYTEAEEEYRAALTRSADDLSLKCGLAGSFLGQGKLSQALVVVEDVLQRSDDYAPALVLHAKLLLRSGESQRAAYQYRAALNSDPSIADAELSAQLGMSADPTPDDESEVSEGRVRAPGGEEAAHDAKGHLERPKISFADVGGMEDLKEEIRLKIIYPLTNHDLYKAYGKAAGGGILLYGPPGCGKTYLARATAGELKAGFLSVGIHEVLDMWIGRSERNLHELFETARRHAPCVLFFDEVDALGANRSDLRQSYSRMVINQFLAEMDGAKDSNEGVLILGATNAPWHLDAAFLRPGRFDRVIFVPPPDAPARGEILKLQLTGKPLDSVDYGGLGKKTEGFSGADLKALVDVAIEGKLREALQHGVPKPLSTKDLQAAAKQVRPSTQPWFATARNYALYSNEGGRYDDIVKYLKLT